MPLIDEHLQPLFHPIFLAFTLIIENGNQVEPAIEFHPMIQVLQSDRDDLIPKLQMFLQDDASCTFPIFLCQFGNTGLKFGLFPFVVFPFLAEIFIKFLLCFSRSLDINIIEAIGRVWGATVELSVTRSVLLQVLMCRIKPLSCTKF